MKNVKVYHSEQEYSFGNLINGVLYPVKDKIPLNEIHIFRNYDQVDYINKPTIHNNLKKQKSALGFGE